MRVNGVLLCLWASVGVAAAQPAPTTRELDRINWMEFREWVPARTATVLVPLGTLEPHGVTANGADILAPVAIARAIAPRLNAMIAPVVPYGVTGSMDAYPGHIHRSRGEYRAVRESGAARSGEEQVPHHRARQRPRRSPDGDSERRRAEIGREVAVRTLVVNWWSYCSDVTLEVFGEDGGHAGDNEKAFMMAIDPALVHKERYTGPDMTTANPAPGRVERVPEPVQHRPLQGRAGVSAVRSGQARRRISLE